MDNGINIIGYSPEHEGGVLIGHSSDIEKARMAFSATSDEVKKAYPTIAAHAVDAIGTLIEYLQQPMLETDLNENHEKGMAKVVEFLASMSIAEIAEALVLDMGGDFQARIEAIYREE